VSRTSDVERPLAALSFEARAVGHAAAPPIAFRPTMGPPGDRCSNRLQDRRAAGLPADQVRRKSDGIVSTANEPARARGVTVGMKAAEAARLMLG
jgi:hypothetical protein